MRLYKRGIEVIVGQNDSAGIKISELYIQIEIKKIISAKPDEGYVRVYNLSRGTERQIMTKGVRVRVSAGHNGQLALLHDGDIRRIDHERDGLNRVTIITLGGNVEKLKKAITNKSYSGQVPIKQIVRDILPSFGIIGVDIDQIPDNAYINDFAFSGKSTDALDKVLKPVGVQWYESDNFIRFSRAQNALGDVILLTPDTGLVGSAALTEKGCKFISVLNPGILLNNRIKIESETVNGTFKVTQLLHRGDNMDGEFVTEGEAITI